MVPPHWFRTLLLCFLLGLIFQSQLFQSHPSSGSIAPTPASIRQGPLADESLSSADPYWYQTGALGSSASYSYVAASVMIRTTYDQVNNDAHSYWVGGFIANSAFIQVGFLNEITTTGQAFCCAWFFEYFYPTSSLASGCCAPKIGPQGSAGPIGSWHNYSMVSQGDGTWSFYMDGTLLGRSLDLGGAGAVDSGSNPPGAIAEVASASSNKDTIGPGEFKNLSFRVSGGNWQPVPQARSLIWYGKGSFDNGTPPPNPYGTREVEGIDNDFLAGSFIPQLNNATSPQYSTPDLWPVSKPPCCITFTFLDPDSNSLQPSWVSFQASNGTLIFYTQYGNQLIEDGAWSLQTVMWHSANVTLPSPQFTTPVTSSQAFRVDVFSVRIQVLGLVSGLPVAGGTVTTTFPDTLQEATSTSTSGNASLTQLPEGLYAFRVTVPFGIPAILAENVTGPLQVTARVFALVEVLLITGVPIGIAVLVLVFAIRREQKRSATMPSIPPSLVAPEKRSTCGHTLPLGLEYCPQCGAPVKPSSN